jgi:GT2 family glycosyltransferase
MIAVRTEVAAQAPADVWGKSDPISALTELSADECTIAHLPRVLCNRMADLPPPPPHASLIVPVQGHTRIGVVIPTRNGADLVQTCIDSLRRTAGQPSRLDIVIIDNGSDDQPTLDLLANLEAMGAARVLRDPAPFNWARLSNSGAASCDSSLLLFLNNDVEITTHGWDDILRRHLNRPDLGAVGARLLYPDGGIQHGGMVLGPDGRAEHEGAAAVGVPDDIAARWITRRRVGAVTGAFLACRREDFETLRGFDAVHLPIWFNDVDFCLRLRKSGKLILYVPEIVATHHESRTLTTLSADQHHRVIWSESLAKMRHRWGSALEIDPGFNPHFARTGRPFEAMMEPSITAIREHLILSARRNPWEVM